MSQYLPTGNFKWFTDKQIAKLNIDNLQHDSNKGLIFEVDLECPKELHHLPNDYPLAAEKIKVSENMFYAIMTHFPTCQRYSTKISYINR